MKRALQFLILPSEITAFERRYLDRVNRIALWFFVLHVPVLVAVAALNDTGPLRALALSMAVVAGPVLAKYSLSNPRAVSIVHGIAAMFMGGVLVHFGQGPMQIEMHFYFFALLAMCAVFGNPMVIIAAAVTVALHHLIVWLVIPRSVFNYDASAWVVVVHAAFVVLESIAACFISRSFFDNVIGLERIVEARTLALDVKNREMRLLLDSVEQGFLTIDRDGTLAPERSAAIDEWFGAPESGASWFDFLAQLSSDFSRDSALAWDEVREDVMPLALTLEQMPRRFAFGQRTFGVEYRPIGSEPHDRFLVIVTDLTSRTEQERADAERRETMALFERILADRLGCESFLEEGSQIVSFVERANASDLPAVKRVLHTLKGNASLMGVTSITTLCHDLEDFIALEASVPTGARLAPLREQWARIVADAERLLGKRARTIDISDEDYSALLLAVRSGESKDALTARVESFKLEPAANRLKHFAEQASRIADRLQKPELSVRITGGGVRLDPKKWAGFWGTFVHAIRNAVDHGIESPDMRVARGKKAAGTIDLTASERDGVVSIEIVDDGNGIDWEAVRTRAVRAGLSAESSADLHRCLFENGISTAERVTELSGRGVGMGALMQATRELGGELDVKSTPGRGTRLRMSIPTTTAGAQPRASSAAA